MDHDRFQSPFSWRYGSDEMRTLWSERHKRRLWRRLWVELARAQQAAGLVTAEQVADLEAHMEQIDVARALEIESRIHHDLMAEVQTFAEQCAIGGGIIHLGATSADIEDNADALRLQASLKLLLDKLSPLLRTFADLIEQYADTPTMAFTHLQPAEPTTMGYRLAMYAQDLNADYATLSDEADAFVRGKGFKGAVGTRASYGELLEGATLTAGDLETEIVRALGSSAYLITGQTYPRKQDYRLLSTLSGLAASLAKFAFDLRLLQSPLSGEWAEPFASGQVGSSAMPFKRNPINAEKLNSLARLIASLVQPAWENAAYSGLERTLDDSANRREILPVAFLAADEMLIVAQRLLSGMRVDETAATRLIERYGPFAATERVLMAAVKAGADRQAIHEHLREQSMIAWAAVGAGAPNPLLDNLLTSETLTRYLTPDVIREKMNAARYVGDAPERARAFADILRSTTPYTP